MAIIEGPFSDADLHDFDWPELTESEEFGDFWSVGSHFFKCADEEDGKGNSSRGKVFKLMGAATSIRLCVGGRPAFQPMVRTRDGRSAAIEDFGESDALVLARMALLAPSPALKAKLADVASCISVELGLKLWRSGALAAEQYFELAEAHLLSENGMRVVDEFRRGLVLVWMYCRNDETLSKKYWDLVQRAIDHSLSGRSPGVAFILSTDAIRGRPDLAPNFSLAFEKRAQRFAAESDYDSAARCYDIARQFWIRTRSRDDVKRCHLLQGEALVSRASVGTSTTFAHSTWLAEGIEVLRRAGADHRRVLELRDTLERLQRESLDSFVHHEHSTDVSEAIKEVEARLIGPNLIDGLLQTAYDLGGLPREEQLRRAVLDNAEKFPLSAIFGSQHVNSDGAVVALDGPLDTTDEESIYGSIVRLNCDFHIPFHSNVILIRAAEYLFTTFHPSESIIYEIVAHSPMIPDGHEATIARGLLAGINGDWLDATMYLVGKMEPIVRHLFRQNGVITLALRDDGTQSEMSLTELLASEHSERVLGKSNILMLQTLMVHRLGFHLRHDWAHGLVSDSGLVGPAVVAMWWLVWRIVLFPWMKQRDDQVSSGDEGDGSSVTLQNVEKTGAEP